MSRIAKEPVALPSDVKAEFKGGQLLVSKPRQWVAKRMSTPQLLSQA